MTESLFTTNEEALPNRITLFIPGIPKPKQSVRSKIIAPIGKKAYVGHYQSKEVKENEQNIRAIVISQLPHGFTLFDKGIVITRLHYSFPPLKSFSKKLMARIEAGEQIDKTTKPDLTDNLNKGVFDALEGLIYKNDSQICGFNNCKKFYSKIPGITLTIEEKE